MIIFFFFDMIILVWSARFGVECAVVIALLMFAKYCIKLYKEMFVLLEKIRAQDEDLKDK